MHIYTEFKKVGHSSWKQPLSILESLILSQVHSMSTYENNFDFVAYKCSKNWEFDIVEYFRNNIHLEADRSTNQGSRSHKNISYRIWTVYFIASLGYILIY